MDGNTKAMPRLAFSIEANKSLQSHFNFALVGDVLHLVTYKKTTSKNEKNEDVVAFVPQSSTPIADNIGSFKETEEIVGHLRWTIDQLKRKVIVMQSAAITGQLEAVKTDKATLALEEAAKVAALAAANPAPPVTAPDAVDVPILQPQVEVGASITDDNQE